MEKKRSKQASEVCGIDVEQVPAGHPFSPWSVAKMGGAFLKTDCWRESSN